jgi:hypothetical protein
VRIFLTSDSAKGEHVFRDILHSLGHQVEEPASAGAGALLANQDSIADLVIAVLWASRPSQQRRSAVLVEIGIAIGRNVPVLLVTKPGVLLPALVGVPRLVAQDNVDGLLAVQVDLFIRGLQQAPMRTPFKSRGPSTGPHADLARTAGLEFEDSVEALLRSAAVEVLKPDSQSDTRADFTLYFSGDDADLGVVLIETKAFTASSSTDVLRRSANQLSAYVASSRASFGLVIYKGPARKVATAPLVAAISLDDLRFELAERSLVDVLRRARNEAIHGR